MKNTEANIVVVDGKTVIRYTATDEEGHKWVSMDGCNWVLVDGTDPLTHAHNTCKELAHQANEEADIAKQAVKIIRDLLYVHELGKNELAIQRAEARAKQFVEKYSENA